MTRGKLNNRGGVKTFAVVGMLYLAAGLFAVSFSGNADNTASIWPGSGIALAALVMAPRHRALWVLAGVAAGSAVCNLWVGAGLWSSFAYTVANTVEPVVALVVARRLGLGGITFERPGAVGKIAVSCMASAIVSASVSAELSGARNWDFLTGWFLTATFGELIFAPLILTLYEEYRRIGSGTRSLNYPLLALSLGETLAVCAAVFVQSALPLLFVPILPVLHATYRHGVLGGALAVTIVAISTSLSIACDTGPFHLLDSGVSTILFAQFYLVTVLTAVLPLAATLAAGRTILEEITLQKRYFELASQTARIGHWRIDVESSDVTWSDAMFRIHGWTADRGNPSFAEAIEAYHRDDKARVARQLEDCAMNGGGVAYDARIRTPRGEIRHIECRGRAENDPTGEVRAIFGIVQDVTDRVLIQQQLEQARVLAESEARNARQLAETDPLTGIASRRRIMALLEEATRRADADGSDLTIAVMDIDHFKSINDRYGHAVGDDVICAVVHEASKALRPVDVIGRIGGEEFLVVLDNVAIDEAASIAERIRLRVSTMAERHLEVPEVTVSIGLAIYRATMGPGDLFRAADLALYDAKRGGRNMLRVA